MGSISTSDFLYQIGVFVAVVLVLAGAGYFIDAHNLSLEKESVPRVISKSNIDAQALLLDCNFDTLSFTSLGASMGTLNKNGKYDEIQGIFDNDCADSMLQLIKMHQALNSGGKSLLQRTEIKKILFSQSPLKEIDLAMLNINRHASKEKIKVFIENYLIQFDSLESLEEEVTQIMISHYLAHSSDMTLAQYKSGLFNLKKAFSLLSPAFVLNKNLIITTHVSNTSSSKTELIVFYNEAPEQIAKKLEPGRIDPKLKM